MLRKTSVKSPKQNSIIAIPIARFSLCNFSSIEKEEKLVFSPKDAVIHAGKNNFLFGRAPQVPEQDLEQDVQVDKKFSYLS